MTTCRMFAAAVTAALGLAASAVAQTTFNYQGPVATGGAAGLWSTAGNWDQGAIPNDPTHIARFNLNTAAAYDVRVDGNYTVRALQFGANSTGPVSVVHTGTTGLPRVLALTPNNGGGTTLTVEGGAGNVTIGSASVAGVPSNNLQLQLGGGSAGTAVGHVWDVQGGSTLTVNAQVTATSASRNTLTKTGTGTLVLNNGNSVNPLFNGGLTVSGGAVFANNSSNTTLLNRSATGLGPVAVNAGGTLGGNGAVRPGLDALGNANQVTINAAGTLSAGTSATAPNLQVSAQDPAAGLQMNPGSQYAVRLFGIGTTTLSTGLTGDQISRVDINGRFSISGASLALDLRDISPGDVATLRANGPRTFTIMTADSQSDGSGFSAFTVNLGNFADGEFTYTNAANFDLTNNQVTLSFTPSPVPEPQTTLGLAAAGAGLAGAARRRFRRAAAAV